MSMQTRPLIKSDYDQIVQVIDRWWGGPTSALAHPIFFYELGRLARVVERDGLMVGFLFGFICPLTMGDPERVPQTPPITMGGRSVGYVHLVGIHPDHRRHGVGKLLYQAFEEDCRREGCGELKAITTLGNEASVRFHQALGWMMTETEDYAGPGRMRIVFRRDLSV